MQNFKEVGNLWNNKKIDEDEFKIVDYKIN